jgi:N-acetylglutamate synthase-like GNAT family acetyltransferase
MLDRDAAWLIAAETALARRDRAWPGALGELLHDLFVEVGASGRAWTRDEIVALLATDPAGDVDLTSWTVRPIAPDVTLVTYETVDRGPGGRHARRASLWLRDQRGDGGPPWRLVYHQGTIVPAAPAPQPARDPDAITVRDATPADQTASRAFLEEVATRRVARRGELLDAAAQPALVAERAGRLVGVLTYVIGEADVEVLTLHATEAWHGIGTALLAAVEARARALGRTTIWLITTNDNVDAIRFYQKRGFRLAEADLGAVDRARTSLKPEIPVHGAYGIPIRDELRFERRLDAAGVDAATTVGGDS